MLSSALEPCKSIEPETLGRGIDACGFRRPIHMIMVAYDPYQSPVMLNKTLNIFNHFIFETMLR